MDAECVSSCCHTLKQFLDSLNIFVSFLTLSVHTNFHQRKFYEEKVYRSSLGPFSLGLY